MKKIIGIGFVLAFAAMASNTVFASPASDHVIVIDPYVRAVPPGQTISAAFMQLENNSDLVRTIVNASSPVCKIVELHSHVHEYGMMKMRRLDSLDLAANGKTILQPGGLHIMLIGLQEKLKLDQKIPLTLEFADGSSKTITAPVRKIMMQDMMPAR